VACVKVESGPTEAVLMEGPDSLGRAMGILVDLEHPTIGAYPRLKSLSTFSRSDTLAATAPLCGQDTDAVIRELGYSDERINELRAQKVLG
jgi:formyl-CoA transferase